MNYPDTSKHSGTGQERSLRWLLQWAHQQWTLETPSLGHSVSLTDAGGSPDMKAAAKAYLGLLRKGDGPDDWERTACKVDRDGFYVTPLRAAMTRIRSLAMRRFLHDLIPNAMQRPGDVAELHGMEAWYNGWVMQGALEILYREYRAAPLPERSWVDMSESSQRAIVAGESAA